MKLRPPHRIAASCLLVAALLLIRGQASFDFAPIEPESAWELPIVRVCWAGPAYLQDLIATGRIRDVDESMAKLMVRAVNSNAVVEAWVKEKANIQATIEREYNDRGTGIRFTGWKDCADDAAAQAYIFTGTNAVSAIGINGQSSIGECSDYGGLYTFPFSFESGYFREKGQRAAVFLKLHRAGTKKVSLWEADALTALHEFGHLAGLRHEHIRRENKSDPNCKLTGDDWMTETPHETTKYIGLYAPQSVMNYCWIHLVRDSRGKQFLVSDTPAAWPEVMLGARVLPSQVSFTDATVVSSQPTSYQSLRGRLYTAKIALSANDVRSLRCLYLPAYAAATAACR